MKKIIVNGHDLSQLNQIKLFVRTPWADHNSHYEGVMYYSMGDNTWCAEYWHSALDVCPFCGHVLNGAEECPCDTWGEARNGDNHYYEYVSDFELALKIREYLSKRESFLAEREEAFAAGKTHFWGSEYKVERLCSDGRYDYWREF